MQIAPPGYKPSSMFEDSWVVCPAPGCRCNERDETAHYSFSAARWSCNNGHIFDERYALLEIQGR